MVGETRIICVPQRQGKEWIEVVYEVEVLEEIDLPLGNQSLYRVGYSDGKTGTAWANQLRKVDRVE